MISQQINRLNDQSRTAFGGIKMRNWKTTKFSARAVRKLAGELFLTTTGARRFQYEGRSYEILGSQIINGRILFCCEEIQRSESMTSDRGTLFCLPYLLLALGGL
jgi:hypothetical protein